MNNDFQDDYYEMLGVVRTAPPDEIRRAFFRLVRKHPPEKDPEGYKEIRQAYDTLSDDRARKEYDALWQFGPEISTLMRKADAAVSIGNYEGASRWLKRVLVLNPYASGATIPLVNCLIKIGKSVEAIVTLERAIKNSPDMPSYRILLGNMLLQKYSSLEYSEGKIAILDQARLHFEKAIELDNQNVGPLLEMAKSYVAEQRFNEALNWAEKAVSADGRADFTDFEVLFFIAEIHAMSGKPEKVLDAAKRIEELVPDDTDKRYYVAGRFVEHAISLIAMREYTPAHYFVKAAVRFDPFNPEITRIQRDVEVIYNADQHWKEFDSDLRIIRPIKRLASYSVLQFAGVDSNKDYKYEIADVENELRGFPRHEIVKSVNLLKMYHSYIFAVSPDVWENLLENPGGSLGQWQQSSGVFDSGEKNAQNGCGCLMAMVLAGIFAQISGVGGFILGAVAGFYLGRYIMSKFKKIK